MFHQVTSEMSTTMFYAGSSLLHFMIYLNIYSLGLVAFERYKAVKIINSNEHLRAKTVLQMILSCILASVIFTIPFVVYMNESGLSSIVQNLDDVHHDRSIASVCVTVALTLNIVSTFILITVLYIKITILIRTRVSRQPFHLEQVRQAPH